MSGLEYDATNIFSKMVDGDVPCYKIFETEHALAFLDAFPVCPGHCLIMPKMKGACTLMDMSPEAVAQVTQELPRLSRAVRDATGAAGVNVMQNNMEGAGQTVFHPHWHVVPRHKGDAGMKMMTAPAGSMIASDVAKDMQKKIRAELEATVTLGTQRSVGFYVRTVTNLLQGEEGEPPIGAVKLVAVAEAINSAGLVSSILQKDGLATIVKAQTTQVTRAGHSLRGGKDRGVPQLTIWMKVAAADK